MRHHSLTTTSNNTSFLARQPKADAVVYDTAGPVATGPNGNVVAYFGGNKRDMTGAPALFEQFLIHLPANLHIQLTP